MKQTTFFLIVGLFAGVSFCAAQSRKTDKVAALANDKYLSKEYMLKDTSFSKKIPWDEFSWQEGAELCSTVLNTLHTSRDFDIRKAEIRHQILHNLLLDGIPIHRKLNYVMSGKQELSGYTVENLAFEVLPGVWTYANVYRPSDGKALHPAMILAHGHSRQEIGPNCGRMSQTNQIIAASLAKMGAIVFCYDMFGYGENGEQVGLKAHYSGLSQSINVLSARSAIDWLETQPDVDMGKIGMTGASGGGTQTFYTVAVDDRITLSVPVVMVSSYFPGGCACESGRPIHTSVNPRTSNAEIAAMAVPRKQLVISDGGDWTQKVDKVEYPFIRSIYALYGAENNVENAHFADEKHNYGPSKRFAMYDFVAKNFGLDKSAIQNTDGEYDESGIVILPFESLLVFNHNYPSGSLETPDQVYDALVAINGRK